MSKIGSAAASIGKGIAVGVAGIAVAGTGVAVGLYKIGESFDAAYDKIRISTGATGKTLQGFEDSVKTIFSSVPTDLGKASDAFVTLQQRTGGSGKVLETVTEQLLELSRTTKTDLTTNVGAAEDAFQSFGVKLGDQPKLLDELFRAFQATGTSLSDIGSQVADAAPQLQALGFNFEQAAALAATLGKAGSSVSDVMPALSKAMAVAAKQGKDASTVFSETFDAIKKSPTDVQAAGIALQVFGAKAGPKLAELIRTGKLSYQDLLKTMQGGSDTILGAGKDTQDFSEKLTLFKNRLKVALEPVALKVFDALGAAMDKLGPVFDKGGKAVAKAMTAIKAGFSGDIKADGIIGVFERIGAAAHTVFEGAKASVAGFIDAFKSGSTDGASGFVGFIEKLGVIAREVFDWLRANGPAIFAALKTAGEAALRFLGEAFEKIGDVLVNKVYPVIKRVIDFMLAHKETLVGVAVAVGVAFAAWAISAASAAIATLAAVAPLVAVAVAIGALVAGVIYAYKHWKGFHDVVDAVGRFMKNTMLPVLKEVGAWLKDSLVPAIKDAASWLGDKLAPAFKAIGDFIETSVIPAAEKFAHFFAEKILPVVEKVIVGFAKFYAKVAEVMYKVLQVVVPIIIKVDTWILKLYLTVAKLYIKFAEVFGHIIVKVVEFGVKVGKVIADVVKWFIDFGEKVYGIGQKVVSAIAGIVGKFIEVATTVGEKVGEIVGVIVGIGARVLAGAGDVFHFLQTSITDAKNWVSDRVDDIVGFVKGIGTRIAEFSEDLFYDVKLAITIAKNWVSDKVDDVVQFFKDLPGHIKDAIVGLENIIKQPFEDAFGWIQDTWDKTVKPILDQLQHPLGIGASGSNSPEQQVLEVRALRSQGKTDEEISKIIGKPVGSFDVGGKVPGPIGKAVLALVHAGETILPTHKMSMPKALQAVHKSMATSSALIPGGMKLPSFDNGGVVTPGGVGPSVGIPSFALPDTSALTDVIAANVAAFRELVATVGTVSDALQKWVQKIQPATGSSGSSGSSSSSSSTTNVSRSTSAVTHAATAISNIFAGSIKPTPLPVAVNPFASVARFDVGGKVPGSKGAPVPAILHAGEIVLPTHKMSFTKALESVRNSVASTSSVSRSVMSTVEKQLSSGRIAQFDSGGIVGGNRFAQTLVKANGNQLTVVNHHTGSRQKAQPIHVTVVQELDGKVLSKSVSEYSNAVGGIAVRVRPRS